MSASEYDLMAPIGGRIIPLYGKVAAGRVAVVDEADFELTSQYRWNVKEFHAPTGATYGPYAIHFTNENGQPIPLLMHKLITGFSRTDHRDHYGLNNRRANLRAATNGQNMANRRKQAGCTSAYKGVYWNRTEQAWRAQIRVNKKRINLGAYSTEAAAARAYDTAAVHAFGEFALPNFPPLAEVALAGDRKSPSASA